MREFYNLRRSGPDRGRFFFWNQRVVHLIKAVPVQVDIDVVVAMINGGISAMLWGQQIAA